MFSLNKNRFSRALAVLVFGLLIFLPDLASAQFANQGALPSYRQTYRVGLSLTTAASATDFLTIVGSATKTVAVTRAECNGIGSTAATPEIFALRRSTANTGGTSTTPAPTTMDTNNAAATAVVRAYTANPGALGTVVGSALNVARMPMPLAATGADLTRTNFINAGYTSQPVVLRGVAQTFALNGNGATLAAGAVVDCLIEWIEYQG